MDCEGILNACTINVVPNKARITVTKSDSIYSRTVAGWVSARCAAAASRACTAGTVSDGTRFLSCHRRPIVSGPRWPPLAPLLFSFSPSPSRQPVLRSALPLETLFYDPGRFRQPLDKRPGEFRAIAKIPEASICDRCGRCVRPRPQWLPPQACAARTFGQLRSRHPNKLRLSRLHTRRPGARAWFVRQSSPLHGRGADICPDQGAARKVKLRWRSRGAHGFWIALPRSNAEIHVQVPRSPPAQAQ